MVYTQFFSENCLDLGDITLLKLSKQLNISEKRSKQIFDGVKDSCHKVFDVKKEAVSKGVDTEWKKMEKELEMRDSADNIDEIQRYCEKNIGIIRRYADHGNADAQYRLGKCYCLGFGIQRDFKEAAKWYQLSTEQGNHLAQYFLGRCYSSGEGVDKNDKEAVRLFKLAAEKGNPQAYLQLGFCYDIGFGVTQDDKEAVKWFKLAAGKDVPLAQFNLSLKFLKGEGIEKNETKAIKMLMAASNNGLAEAQYKLGKCYEEGLGVTLNKKKALKLYKLAADQGLIRAKIKLKKENCFITTAVCNHYKRPDDCYELNLLRWYRDTWLVDQDNGSSLISEYYCIAPEIVDKINDSDNSRDIYRYLEEKYIRRCISLIESKEYSFAKEHYIEMINYLKVLFS